MPVRVYGLLLGVAGVLAVAGLFLIGRDVWAATRTGPSWKRRLVGAGLLLLAALGVIGYTRKPRMVPCYAPMPIPPSAEKSYQRLDERLPAVEALLAAEVLDPKTAAKLLQAVERELAVLESQQVLEQLGETQRAKAVELREKVKAQVEEIKARLRAAGHGLDLSPDWKLVVQVWREAGPLAETGQSTIAQREWIDGRLGEAKEATARLEDAGRLSSAESKLLVLHAERLRADIYRGPPTDSRVTCYDMMFIPPARESLESLAARLPLLRSLTESGALHPTAIRALLPAIKRDIATLSSEEELKKLPEGELGRAEKTRADVEAALGDIQRLLEAEE